MLQILREASREALSLISLTMFGAVLLLWVAILGELLR